MAQKFKVTYATMSADNEELQSAFDKAVEFVQANWVGMEVPMFIDGERAYSSDKMDSYSPIDTNMRLCTAQKGTVDHAKAAIAAAKAAAPIWAATPWQERVAIMRRIADNISDNIFELSAIMVLEVGKSRLEAMGEVEETADLLRYYAQSMEDNGGFLRKLGQAGPQG